MGWESSTLQRDAGCTTSIATMICLVAVLWMSTKTGFTRWIWGGRSTPLDRPWLMMLRPRNETGLDGVDFPTGPRELVMDEVMRTLGHLPVVCLKIGLRRFARPG